MPKAKAPARKNVRSAINGRYLPKAAAKRDPDRTVTETVKKAKKRKS